jgi:hypothetical protein
MRSSNFKYFECTGVKTIDVTVRARVDELVMVDMGTLNDVYQQGFMDGVTDTIGESSFFSVCTMEAEDEHA